MIESLNSRPPSYWEIQKKQKWITSGLFLLLFLFYLLTIGLISSAILLSLGFFFPSFSLFSFPFFYKYAFLVFLISIAITLINFIEARKGGANYILTNLRAYPPDPDDRYHLSFLNVIEEMRISSGLPMIKGYIIPSVNINSLSLIDKDNLPAVVVTEGLLGEASRDELQAVVAHEVAHILKGDTFLLTLICSISAFYKKLLDSAEENRSDYDYGFDALSQSQRKETRYPLIYLASLLSYFLINFLVTIINQNREFLADATAVELSRDPLALARIIYKAQIANSYLGDSSLFTPLFLVPPDSREISESPWSRLFNTHPPVRKRLQALTQMSHLTIKDLIASIRTQEEVRQKNRTEIKSIEELSEESRKAIKSLQENAERIREKEKFWMIKNSQGKWEGPYTLGALIALPYFSPAIRVKNLKENQEGKAREFPQIRFALYNQFKNQPVDPALYNKCPFCRSDLSISFYEGVKIKSCSICRGKLVHLDDLEKIFARKELHFSDKLKEKARLFQEEMMKPEKRAALALSKKSALCPECGLQLSIRPFSYHYLLPVYKCYHCQLIWFEADELEILQIFIEKGLNVHPDGESTKFFV